jgi:L-seryl-tRNA(Ser) seleniumtransferase
MRRKRALLPDPKAALRAIPSVDLLLGLSIFERLQRDWRREGLRRYLQIRLDDYRDTLRKGARGLEREAILTELAPAWAADWKALSGSPTRRVINGTGVLLHTNLGRAALGFRARKALATAARWPVDLELDLGGGLRASRTRKVDMLLRAWSGAEAAFAVNNNAAALTLAVDTLARKRRLIVSRGEQVEIGGSFRLPEILERFAGKMVEVGTTNRTRLADYEKAITRKGDVLLKVHRSNFRQIGYTQEAGLEELVALGRAKASPVIYDLGSGRFDSGMDWLDEPVFETVLAADPDLITFSGDKIFGGPQAGIILGRASLIASLRKNPLARALRLDKLTLAALGESIAERLRLEGDIPSRAALDRDQENLEVAGRHLLKMLRGAKISGMKIALEASEARSGGGAAAENPWPSVALRITMKDLSAGNLAARLRSGNPAVLGTVRKETFFLDLAALDSEEFPKLVKALAAVGTRKARRA